MAECFLASQNVLNWFGPDFIRSTALTRSCYQTNHMAEYVYNFKWIIILDVAWAVPHWCTTANNFRMQWTRAVECNSNSWDQKQDVNWDHMPNWRVHLWALWHSSWELLWQGQDFIERTWSKQIKLQFVTQVQWQQPWTINNYVFLISFL